MSVNKRESIEEYNERKKAEAKANKEIEEKSIKHYYGPNGPKHGVSYLVEGAEEEKEDDARYFNDTQRQPDYLKEIEKQKSEQSKYRKKVDYSEENTSLHVQDQTKYFNDSLNIKMSGVGTSEINVSGVLDRKTQMYKLMIESWSKMTQGFNDTMKAENNFEDYIFFVTIIWPQTDPRKKDRDCDDFTATILKDYQQPTIDVLVDLEEDNVQEKYLQLQGTEKEEFEKSLEEKYKQGLSDDFKNSICFQGNSFDAYKKKFIEKISSTELSNKSDLSVACLQYLKNKDGSGYEDNIMVTKENLEDFFENNLSSFLSIFKPYDFDVGVNIALKFGLFKSEIFQQNYVEEYIQNLFKVKEYLNEEVRQGRLNEVQRAKIKLLNIENSHFPTIATISANVPGLVSGGAPNGAPNGAAKVVDELNKSTGTLLEEVNKNYGMITQDAQNNIKIQLRLLFDDFIKTIISPKIDEIFRKRAEFVQSEFDSKLRDTINNLQLIVDNKNK